MKANLTRVLEVESIIPLFESAKAAQIQADATNQQLAAAMLKWVREQVPDGTVIDLRHKPGNPLPEYLRNVSVASGNSRGTKLFRIERIRFVEPDVRHPDLSSWYADATPISMSTGKDMSGAAGNSRSSNRKFLGLRGYFGFEAYSED